MNTKNKIEKYLNTTACKLAIILTTILLLYFSFHKFENKFSYEIWTIIVSSIVLMLSLFFNKKLSLTKELLVYLAIFLGIFNSIETSQKLDKLQQEYCKDINVIKSN